MLHWADPWWLLALPLPWLAGYLRLRRPARDQPALLHPHAALLAQLSNTEQRVLRLPWLWALGCALFIVALARPLWLDPNDPATHQGRDIMLALDVSGSMRAQDFALNNRVVSRLDVVKAHAGALLHQRRDDQFGIIVFGDDAYTLTPPSGDVDMIGRMLQEVSYGLAGERTALGSAVALAVQRLKDRPPAGRVLLLFTDGANTAGDITPQAALVLAREYRVRIYTIGLGNGRRAVYPGAGNAPLVAEAPLDEALLQQLARGTGGHYYRAGDTQTLEKILRDIAQLETTPIKDLPASHGEEWYWLPLVLGLLLLCAAHYPRRGEALP